MGYDAPIYKTGSAAPPEEGEQEDFAKIGEGIEKQYPALRGHNWSLLDSRGTASDNRGHLEFYPPDELYNPTPGRPTIEVFDKDLKGKALETAVMGDMLHHLPAVDPAWKQMRQELHDSLTEDQLKVDRQAYEREKKQGEDRPFEDWMTQSRLDAYVRGHLTPDKDDDWKDVYNKEQKAILKRMKTHLSEEKKETP